MLSRMFEALSLAAQEQHITELLELNGKTEAYGLALTPAAIRCLLAGREEALRHHARLELGIEATKALIDVFAGSPYMRQEIYADALHELQEIFYYMKNETEDEIGDRKLIEWMRDCYDEECGGSLELLRGKLEPFAERFRAELPPEWYEGEET